MVLRVASLTRTLSVDTLFGNKISASCFCLLHQTVGLVLKLPAQGFQLDCDTVPTVHLYLCRLQVSIRFLSLSYLCVPVLCDASSQFIFTVDLAPQRLKLLGISAFFSASALPFSSSQRHVIISFAITDIVFLAMMVRMSISTCNLSRMFRR